MSAPEQYYPQPARDDLAFRMFAAWINCDPDKVPAHFRAWTCPQTRQAWERVAAVRAALKVKALVWNDNPDIGEGGFIAKGVFDCTYHAMEDGWCYYRQGLWADAKNLEAAKSAAQADYEARILAALEGGDA